jgi:hypothetical protein
MCANFFPHACWMYYSFAITLHTAVTLYYCGVRAHVRACTYANAQQVEASSADVDARVVAKSPPKQQPSSSLSVPSSRGAPSPSPSPAVLSPQPSTARSAPLQPIQWLWQKGAGWASYLPDQAAILEKGFAAWGGGRGGGPVTVRLPAGIEVDFGAMKQYRHNTPHKWRAVQRNGPPSFAPSPSFSNPPPVVKSARSEQPVEDRGALEDAVISSVVAMGFDHSLVRGVQDAQREASGAGYSEVEALLAAVLAQ